MGSPGKTSKRRAPGKRPARRRDAEPAQGRGGRKSGNPSAFERGAEAGPKRTPTAERLIAAAQKLVADHGYDSLPVGAVWRHAGVSHQTFYNHFPDKRAVVCAGEHRSLAAIDAAIREAQDEGAPWVAELERALDRALSDLHGSQDTPRARLVAAMAQIAAEEGFQAATVSALSRRAGISGSHFHRYFADRRECLAAAVDAVIVRLSAALAEPTADAEGTAERAAENAARVLGALIDALAEDRPGARLVLLEAALLAEPPPGDGPAGWAGSLRALIEDRVLAPLGSLSDAERRFAAGGLVAALRHLHLATGERLERHRRDLVAATLATLVEPGAALAAAGEAVAVS